MLQLWWAFRNNPSKLARYRQIEEYVTLKKRESVERAFGDIVRLVAPLKSLTIMCDWDEDQVAATYDQVTQMLGGTVLTTKTLYFLVPDLFLILDREQSYRPLRKEIRVPRKIDELDGKMYAGVLSYIRSEVNAFIRGGGVATIKGGCKQVIANLDQYRDLSHRQTKRGAMRPGTICKVVDDIFA